jgi:hypothetical protein
MHIPTHILSGWCVANVVPGFNARQRLFCMIAATAADLDGLGIVFGEEAYWTYHHKLGHNVFAAVAIAGVLTIFSARKRLAFVIHLALAHLHLVLDYFGSGPGWPIHYLWPASAVGIVNPRAWPFTSWQNYSAFAALLAGTVWIAFAHRRTPIELLAPRLDHGVIMLLPVGGRRRRLKADAPLPINVS